MRHQGARTPRRPRESAGFTVNSAPHKEKARINRAFNFIIRNRSVAVMIGLERTLLRQTEIVGLLVRQGGQFHADFLEMQHRNLFIEVLGQGVDFFLVLALLGPQFDLRQRLLVKEADITKEG